MNTMLKFLRHFAYVSKGVGGGREGASVVEFACDRLVGMCEKSVTSAILSKDYAP